MIRKLLFYLKFYAIEKKTHYGIIKIVAIVQILHSITIINLLSSR